MNGAGQTIMFPPPRVISPAVVAMPLVPGAATLWPQGQQITQFTVDQYATGRVVNNTGRVVVPAIWRGDMRWQTHPTGVVCCNGGSSPSTLAGNEIGSRENIVKPPSQSGGNGDDPPDIQKQIKRALQELESRYNRVISVVVGGENDEFKLEYALDIPFKPASIIKLFILYVCFRLAEQQHELLAKRITFRPEDHAETKGTGILQHETQPNDNYAILDYLSLMIRYSDNIATNIVIEELGLERINCLMGEFGFSTSALRRRMCGFDIPKGSVENVTTARDVLTLLHRIRADGRIRAFLLDKLSTADEKRYISRSLSDRVRVYVKSGILDDVYHESGYVEVVGRLYPIVIFTANESGIDHGTTEALFSEIGSAIKILF